MSHLLPGQHEISLSYRACMLSFSQLFEQLRQARQAGTSSQSLTPDANNTEEVESFEAGEKQLDDDLGRFTIWAENCGAHRHGRTSLDHRLREAADVKQMVLELLENLNEDLQDAAAVISGKTRTPDIGNDTDSVVSSISSHSQSSLQSEEDSRLSESYVEMTTGSKLKECVTDITHVITCLYKFSITIQNPASRDRLEKSSSIPVSHFELFDIQHISHKFPDAQGYLVERLGKANTKRRQLLMYHELHHHKISGHYEKQISDPPVGSDLGGLAGRNTEDVRVPRVGNTMSLNENSTPVQVAATIITRQTQTTVSTYIPRDVKQVYACSEADIHSQTSFASSIGSQRQTLWVPHPPKPEKAFAGEPFQCPYCYVIVSVPGPQAWKKHVFRDLRPYVCTFKGCQRSDHLFESQHEWFQHELDLHRREWFCNACAADDPPRTYTSRQQFREHLENTHSTLFVPAQIQTVINRCERPAALEQECPLCGEKHLPRFLRRHLGSHMQQISTFVAKASDDDVDGGSKSFETHRDDSDESDGESQATSSLYFGSNPSLNSYTDMEKEKGETSLANLAADFSHQGRHSEAEELDVQDLEIKKRVLGEEHPDALISMANLALTFARQGRYQEAGELYVQVLKIRKRVLGKEYRDALASIANLAAKFSQQGRHEEAEKLNVEAFELTKRVRGPENPDTLTSMANLAWTYKRQGRTEQAIELLDRAFIQGSTMLGPEYPDLELWARWLAEWRG